MKSQTPKPRRSDLPFVKVSALRRAGIITPGMTDAIVEVGGLKRKVSLWHMHFRWNRGSWSYFICPHCSRKCQILRLHDGRPVEVPHAVAILTRLALRSASIRRELGLTKNRLPDEKPDA